MLILLASYPRSGNTMFRMVANSLFGVKSTEIYAPGPGQKEFWQGEVRDLVGHLRLDEVEAEHTVAFLKTHEPSDVADDRPAIYLVRDGRDAYVSYAHFARTYCQPEGLRTDFLAQLRLMVQSPDFFGGWSHNVESWLARKAPTAIVRYEDLVANPEKTVMEAAAKLDLDWRVTGHQLPDFTELRGLMPGFFRKGKSQSWREEMPPDIEELFWQHHGQSMARLGYERGIDADGVQPAAEIETIESRMVVS